MNPQQAKDTSLAYLKVVIHLLNENIDELDFKLGRPLRLDDLDSLTSHQMLNIVVFLLRDVVGDKSVSKPVPLTSFNKLGIGSVSYDCGIDHIYHAVKQIFPEESDLFNYSVLLLPSLNPKRTKAVISYIMSFVLMCDNLGEQFSVCFHEVMKENEEKAAICNEIDDLKDKISSAIQEIETEKERLPSVQRDLQNLEETIRKHQSVLAKFIAEAENHKTKFDIKETETKNLEQELERMNMEEVTLEQQIVLNPTDLQAGNQSIKNQLDSETKSREAIGADLEKCSKECDIFDSLIQRAHHVIHSIESVISLMENTKSKIEVYMKAGNEMASSGGKIGLLRQELQKLADRHKEKLADVNKEKEDHEVKIKELTSEQSAIDKQIVLIKEQSNAIKNKSHEIAEIVDKIDQDIEKLKDDIAANVRYVHEIVPHYRSLQEAEAVKFLQRMTESFSNFPKLK